MRLFIATVFFVMLSLSGCQEDFTPGSVIDRTRVIGAKVMVEGDPERASPEPLENVRVEWFMASERRLGALQWILTACTPLGTFNGLPACAEAPFAATTAQGDVPSIDFQIPSRSVLGDRTSVLVLGIICELGPPLLDTASGSFGCDNSNEVPNFVSLQIPIASENFVNHHPAIENLTFSFEGVAWQPSEGLAAGQPCENDSLIRVSVASKEQRILVVVPESEREAVGSMREVFQLSHFSTDGKLEGQFSIVEADQSGQQVLEVLWDAPAALRDRSQGSETVLLYFVARDQRGGMDWATFAVCVVD